VLITGIKTAAYNPRDYATSLGLLNWLTSGGAYVRGVTIGILKKTISKRAIAAHFDRNRIFLFTGNAVLNIIIKEFKFKIRKAYMVYK